MLLVWSQATTTSLFQTCGLLKWEMLVSDWLTYSSHKPEHLLQRIWKIKTSRELSVSHMAIAGITFLSYWSHILPVYVCMNVNKQHHSWEETHVPASMILSTLASLIPLICKSSFLGEYATASTVQRPASLSFFISRAAIPDALKREKQQNKRACE